MSYSTVTVLMEHKINYYNSHLLSHLLEHKHYCQDTQNEISSYLNNIYDLPSSFTNIG